MMVLGHPATVSGDVDSAEIEQLLRAREARGLRVPLAARLMFIGFSFVLITTGLPSVSQSKGGVGLNALVLGTLVVALGMHLYLLRLLRRGDHVERVGLLGALWDASFVILLSWLAQVAGHGDGLPVSYVFKTELPITIVTMVVINGLALRPRYPLIVGVGALLALLFPMLRLPFDPLTRLSTDRAQVYVGDAIDLGHLVTLLAMTAGSTAAVIFATRAARQTIREAIAQEIHNARLKEEQLRLVMREKVRALGNLVAGVCHEVNTPLGVLRSGVDTQTRVLSKIPGPGAEAPNAQKKHERVLGVGRESLATMAQAVDRIARLEQSLRALSHLDEAEFRQIDLHAELDGVLDTAMRGRTSRIERVYNEVPPLYLNAREFAQALLTLVTRALDAAGAEGQVTLRTGMHSDTVFIEISDSGPAIPEAALQAIFDVSFGGAGPRVAAGLELATAQSIVLQHGGELSVKSQQDGVTFTVTLPQPGPTEGSPP